MVKGIEQTNLEPVSGLCVACLVVRSGGPLSMATDEPFDPKMAQAGKDG